MRPSGRSETDSLYFNYPHFAAPAPLQRDKRQRAPVAIVGAGPIGMTAALALAKEGVQSVLFDKKPTFNDGSRAICIARSSLHILERLCDIEPFLTKSLSWTTGRTFYRGCKILEFVMPDSSDEKFRPMYNLQQQYIEQFLWQAVDANEFIETRWQSEITGTSSQVNGQILNVKDPNAEYSFNAEWVLACDGARSPMRKLLGHRLQGENFEGRYVIADIQMDHDYPTIRRAFFDPNCRPGGTVLVHKQPENIWRIDYQLRDDESTEAALVEETVRESVEAVLKDLEFDGAWELEWWSVYTANTLALDDYRDSRVFFVGDSAHIVPIFGVRGLNNGLADAVNIGWKLGWVLNGHAGDGLLNSYTPERRSATLDVFDNASKSARFMTPNTRGWKLMRDAALSLALDYSFAGELANPRQMTPFTYQSGSAQIDDDATFAGGPVVGSMILETPLKTGFLSDYLGSGFTAICFEDELANQIRGMYSEQILSVLTLPLAKAELFAANKQSLYLVRPDLHIAGRWRKKPHDPSGIRNNLRIPSVQN